MTKFLRSLLVLLFLLQILVAAGFELAHDEAYYWLFSRHLDWGYMDHPPFMAAIIRLFSFLPHSEIAVRLGFIVLQFCSLGLIYKMTDFQYRKWVTLLFFSFPLASLTGLLALPDIPLLFMSSLYCLMLKRFLEKKDFSTSILLGLTVALLLYAKYHGALLVLFTIMALPGLLKEKHFYLVTVVALLFFLPHMYWQHVHDYTTLRYHFLERPSSGFSLKRSFEYLGTQIGLAGVFAGPLVWWIVGKHAPKDQFERALKFICLGTVVFFLLSTFSKKFEANWTIFLAVPLIVLVAGSPLWGKKLPQYVLYVSFVLVLVSRVAFLFSPEILNVKRLKEFYGWRDWAQEVKRKCPGTLVANTYQIASKLSFYLETEVHALNYHSRRNQFDIWRWDRKNPIKVVCFITQGKEFQGEPLQTPEGKELTMVTNLPYEELLRRKTESMRESGHAQ
jgi:4-amino-4-deoxy-L-arabinose transferase-like glycosyltransferase